MVTSVSCTNEDCALFGQAMGMFGGGDFDESVPTYCGTCGTQLLGPGMEAPE